MIKKPFAPIRKVSSAKQTKRVTTIKNVVKVVTRLNRPITRVKVERVSNAPMSKSQTIKAAIEAGFSATLFEYLSEGYNSAWFRKYGGSHLEALRKAGFNLSF